LRPSGRQDAVVVERRVVPGGVELIAHPGGTVSNRM